MSRWREQLQNQEPPIRNGHSRGTLLREMAAVYVDVFHAFGELSVRHRRLFDDGAVRVIDLEAPPL